MSPIDPKETAPAKRDRAALALLGAMGLALAITGGASLSAAGSGALQDLLRTAGFGRTSAVEQEQDRQARAIAEIERNMAVVTGRVSALGSRVDETNRVQDRVAKLDTEVLGLKSRMTAAEKTGVDAVRMPAPNGPKMRELEDALTIARIDLAGLRLSIDMQEKGERQEISTITKRLSRIENIVVASGLTAFAKKPPKRPALHAKRRAPES
jgi:hypothetical protein